MHYDDELLSARDRWPERATWAIKHSIESFQDHGKIGTRDSGKDSTVQPKTGFRRKRRQGRKSLKS